LCRYTYLTLQVRTILKIYDKIIMEDIQDTEEQGKIKKIWNIIAAFFSNTSFDFNKSTQFANVRAFVDMNKFFYGADGPMPNKYATVGQGQNQALATGTITPRAATQAPPPAPPTQPPAASQSKRKKYTRSRRSRKTFTNNRRKSFTKNRRNSIRNGRMSSNKNRKKKQRKRS